MKAFVSALVAFALLASGVQAFSSTTASTTPPSVPYKHAQEVQTKQSTFPIEDEKLISLAKYYMDKEVQLGLNDGGACLAENYQFVGPVVGPLPKKSFLKALGGFRLEDSWEIDQRIFGHFVDPLQPNRVWWLGRPTSKQIAPFAGVDVPAEGRTVDPAPQVFHMDFNEEGKVTEFGFATADRLQGNTGGLGGAFCYFHAVGKSLPFPEAKPWKPSLRYRFFMFLGKMAQKFQKNKDED